MELKEHLNVLDNIKETIYENKHLSYKQFKNLVLLKYNYNSLNDNSPQWEKYCKGCILDKNTNTILMVPPIKSIEVDYDYLCNIDDNQKVKFYELIDGVMINIFYNPFEKKWNISTRSEINCMNRWNHKSFKELLYECDPDFSFYIFDEKYTYSFILRHKDNRIISPIIQNSLILVQVRNQETFQIIDIENIDIKYEKISEFSYSNLISNIKDKKLFYGIKGYTFYKDNKRYKIINNNYKRVQEIKPNTNNLMLAYLEIKKMKKMNQYLSYFPENKKNFDKYFRFLKEYTNQLYVYYCNIFIKKSKSIKDVPYEYRKLLYNIHNTYLNSGEKINITKIINILEKTNTKLLSSIINNLFM